MQFSLFANQLVPKDLLTLWFQSWSSNIEVAHYYFIVTIWKHLKTVKNTMQFAAQTLVQTFVWLLIS